MQQSNVPKQAEGVVPTGLHETVSHSNPYRQYAGRWWLASFLLLLNIMTDLPGLTASHGPLLWMRLAMSAVCLAIGILASVARSSARSEWYITCGVLLVVAGFSYIGEYTGAYYGYTVAIYQILAFLVIFIPLRTPVYIGLTAAGAGLWFGLMPMALGLPNPSELWLSPLVDYASFGCIFITGSFVLERYRNSEQKRKINLVEHARKLEARTEAMIQENSRKYEKMLKLSPEPAYLHDGRTIQYANDAFLQLAGVPALEDIRGASVDLFTDTSDEDSDAEQYEMTVKGESLKFQQYRFLKTDGEVIDVEACSIAVNNDPEQPLYQTVLRDLTTRKLVEEKLGRSDKMSALGQLAAGVAHEIKNPLTSLKGFVQLLRKKAPDYPAYYDIMTAELDRINMIVNDFMLLAKPRQADFQLQQVPELLNHVYSLFETQAGLNKIKLHQAVERDIPPLLVDGNQLKQVFINLLKNAIEAMPEGGNIYLYIGCKEEGLSIRIEDEGVGIPPDKLPKLGEPFYTTKESGTGLGLNICYRIIEAHKGSMFISSRPNEGTVVEIVLPYS